MERLTLNGIEPTQYQSIQPFQGCKFKFFAFPRIPSEVIQFKSLRDFDVRNSYKKTTMSGITDKVRGISQNQRGTGGVGQPSLEDLNELMADLQSGIENAKQKIEYVQKTIEYAKKYNKGLSQEFRQVAIDLKRIGNTLELISKEIDKIKQVTKFIEWIRSIDDFATKSINLDIQDTTSLENWTKSAEDFLKKSEPAKVAILGWLAKKGSLATAKANVFTQAFTAYFEFGFAALKAGLKVTKYYIRKTHNTIAEIDRYAEGTTTPPPAPPPEWKSSNEKKEWNKREVSDQEIQRGFIKRQIAKTKRTNEIRRRERLIARIMYEADREFEDRIFPNIYMKKYRYNLAKRIREEYYKTKGDPTRADWYYCFEIQRDLLPGQDHWPINYGPPKKVRGLDAILIRVNLKQAQGEIIDFKSVRPPCPYFNAIYERELKKFNEYMPLLILSLQKEIENGNNPDVKKVLSRYLKSRIP